MLIFVNFRHIQKYAIAKYNTNISGNSSVKYNCFVSKSKLVFPLPNESYYILIASIV